MRERNKEEEKANLNSNFIFPSILTMKKFPNSNTKRIDISNLEILKTSTSIGKSKDNFWCSISLFF